MANCTGIKHLNWPSGGQGPAVGLKEEAHCDGWPVPWRAWHLTGSVMGPGPQGSQRSHWSGTTVERQRPSEPM